MVEPVRMVWMVTSPVYVQLDSPDLFVDMVRYYALPLHMISLVFFTYLLDFLFRHIFYCFDGGVVHWVASLSTGQS